MTNVNKHGVDYSAIEIGDLVKINMVRGETILGYVTYIDGDILEAIWSDDFEVCHESHRTGNICGHWKVVVHEPKKVIPTKPFAQLVSYHSSVLGRKKWGLFSHMEGNDVWAYWEGWSNERVSLGRTHIRDIIDIVDVIVHEPKKLVPTKPYKQLMAFKSLMDDKLIWGIYTHSKAGKYWGNFSDYGKGFLFERDIVDVVDIVVHPSEKKPFFKEGDTVVVTSMRPIDSKGHQEALGLELTVTGYDGKDEYYGQWYWLKHSTKGVFLFPDCNLTLKEDIENPSADQELSVQQEQANFAHAAVQGIINAHADKNGETNEDLEAEIIMSPTELSKLKRTEFAKGYDKATKMYLEGFTFSDFDKSVSRTWKKQDFKDAVSNAALGLTGEAGEVADLIKKGIYHGRGFSLKDNPKAIAKYDVKDELSDVLFYVSAMAQEFGFTLEDIARHNREKLEKRFPEGFSTEASAQKVDRAPEVKPDGEIRIGYVEYYKEDTLEYVGVDKAPFSVTYFSTDYELKNTLKELREGSRVTIEDKHKGEFQFTKVGNLMRVHFKDLEGNLDSHTCLVKVSYEEVTD